MEAAAAATEYDLQSGCQSKTHMRETAQGLVQALEPAHWVQVLAAEAAA